MKLSRDFTLFIIILTLACLGLIAGTAISAPTMGRGPVSNPLRLPFKFEETSSVQPSNVTLLPGNTVIFTETFGASFAPTTTLTTTTPMWHIVANPDDTARYYWGAVGSTGNFSNSVWSATTPITSATPLTPGLSTYPAGQDTWLLYGPIDLSHYSEAQLNFQYYLDTRPGDQLRWAWSRDGQNFSNVTSVSGSSGSQWLSGTLDLDPATFQISKLYIAFAFQSSNSPSGIGAFVRNVSLLGNLLNFTYMPLIMKNYPPTATPTPTPTPTFGYTFDNGSDLNQWGGSFTRTTGGSCWYSQGARGNHGDPGNSFFIWNNCKYLTTAASSNDIAPTNYELIVDLSPWELYGNDLYGVIFGASLDTFSTGSFNANGNFYKLSLATNVANNLVTAILLEKCTGGTCKPLTPGYLGLQALPTGLVYGQSAYWDEIDIKRSGNNIKVSINGQLQIDLDNGDLVGPSKFGVHIFPLAGNDTTNPPVGGQMELDYDNIRLYSLP